MSIALKSGTIAQLFFFAIAAFVTYYYLSRALRGVKLPLRELTAVAAVSDGVDKAVEEGKPIFTSPGNMSYLSGLYAPMTVAGMNMLRYTARLAVRKGARIVMPVPTNPESFPLIDGIFREVCVSEGKPEAYHRTDVRYYGAEEYTYSSGAGSDILREGCSMCVLIGANSTCEGFLMGLTYLQGGLVIAGTARWAHNSTNLSMADYPLFSEDIYAAGAYVSGDNMVSSTLWGGDLFKLILIGSMFVVLGLTLLGLPVVTRWLLQ